MATHSSVLPGESQGWTSLVGCCLWGHTESDTTEATQQQQQGRKYGFSAYTFYFAYSNNKLNSMRIKNKYLDVTIPMQFGEGNGNPLQCS